MFIRTFKKTNGKDLFSCKTIHPIPPLYHKGKINCSWRSRLTSVISNVCFSYAIVACKLSAEDHPKMPGE